MSNYKGYTDSDNVKRKANNIETGHELDGTMKRVKSYGGCGGSYWKEFDKKVKEYNKKSPVKVYTQEEIDELNRKNKQLFG